MKKIVSLFYLSHGSMVLLFCAFLFCVNVRAASSWDGKAPVTTVLYVETDRPDAIYKRGETVTFKIKLEHGKQLAGDETVDWAITKDGLQPPIKKGSLKLKKGRAEISGTLDEPGFLRCDVTYVQGKETFKAPVAAAIEPLQIRPSMPVPDDFDAFWAAKKKQLAAVPINAQLTSVPVPAEWSGVVAFDFQADCIGAPARGYYAKPIGARPKSCPALLFMQGSGVVANDILTPVRWAKQGFIALDVNAHGIPLNQPKEFYTELNEGKLKDYRTHGRESRETYYFLGMYLRDLRALEFLTAQPEWDGRILVMEGVSQGGAQSLAMAALDPRVTFVAVSNPAMCDHTGMLVGRIAGWPKVVPYGTDGKPDSAVIETSRYFDSVNFATRIKAPVYFDIGFTDLITPATGIYAAYNNIPSRKTVYNGPHHGHGLAYPEFWNNFAQIILDEVHAQQAAWRTRDAAKK